MDHKEVKLNFTQKVKVCLSVAGEVFIAFLKFIKSILLYIVIYTAINYILYYNLSDKITEAIDFFVVGFVALLLTIFCGMLEWVLEPLFKELKKYLLEKYEFQAEIEKKKSLEKVDEIILKDK